MAARPNGAASREESRWRIIGLRRAIGREFARLGEATGMNVITWTMHSGPSAVPPCKPRHVAIRE